MYRTDTFRTRLILIIYVSFWMLLDALQHRVRADDSLDYAFRRLSDAFLNFWFLNFGFLCTRVQYYLGTHELTGPAFASVHVNLA